MTTAKVRPRARKPAKPATGKVLALQRGLDVLACFEPSNRPLGHAELARATGLPKPTLTRMVNTLTSAGLLRMDPQEEKYSLGPRVVSFSNAYVNSFDVRAVARPLMQELAQKTGLSVYLAIASDLDMLIIEVARSQTSMLMTRLDIGSRVPMSTSALGRAYLLGLEKSRREELMERMAQTHGVHWSSIRGHIEASLRKAKKLGYCLSLGELYPDIHSIAKAVPSSSGDMVVLNCGGASTYLTSRVISKIAGPALLETAARLSQAIH